jgi:hypothetical protein
MVSWVGVNLYSVAVMVAEVFPSFVIAPPVDADWQPVASTRRSESPTAKRLPRNAIA